MANKSTNVRTKMVWLGLRATALALGTVAPGLAAWWAEGMFFTPRRLPRSPRAEAVLARGRQQWLAVGGERLAVWRWGEGPRVLLVHGWSGLGGQLTAYVEPLVAAGYSVVTFDAPAHGVSSGARTSLPELAGVIREVAERVGGVRLLVGHSLGAAASAVAMRDGLEVERAVLLAPAADPRVAAARFARALGLSRAVLGRMVARVERRLGPMAALVVPDFAPALRVPVRIFHDAHDDEVPLASGEAIARAWPGASLVRTEGLGHYRILYDAGVVARAVAFLTERPAAEAAVLPLVEPRSRVASRA